MVKEEWEPRWSENKILVQAARGFCPQVRGLTEESDSERGHKQGMHTKESHFVFVFHLLPRTSQHSLRKDLNRVWCFHSGKVTGLHPVEGMPSVISPPTQDLVQCEPGKVPLTNGSFRVEASKVVPFIIVFSLLHFILYLQQVFK